MGYIWISVCSVFEGLQIIYSPFRRRELFSFDRFIWRWSSRAIAPRNIDDVYTHGPSRLFFFSLSLSLSLFLYHTTPSSYAVPTPPSPSLSLSLSAIGVLKNDPGHYFYAVLHLFFLFFLSGPAVIRVSSSASPPRRRRRFRRRSLQCAASANVQKLKRERNRNRVRGRKSEKRGERFPERREEVS